MMISDSGLLFWATLYVCRHVAEVYFTDVPRCTSWRVVTG